MNLSENLRRLRLEKGMTQNEVGDAIGLTRQAISGYESGRTQPDIETLMRLADIYDTDLEGILYGNSIALQNYGRIRRTGITIAAVLVILSVLRGGILMGMNRLLPIPQSYYNAENTALRFRLVNAVNLLGSIQLLAADVGLIALLSMILNSKCPLSGGGKYGCPMLVCAVIVLIAALFAAVDPSYQLMDYLWTPLYITVHTGIFLLILLIGEAIRKRRK